MLLLLLITLSMLYGCIVCAQDAGVKLKELIGNESVTFYVSPFVRSKQTYKGIRDHFTDEQVRAVE